MSDPRHGDPAVDGPAIAGLVVAFKALVLRSGGRVELAAAELERAQALHAQVDAYPDRLVVQLVDGAPPDVPRYAARTQT